MPKPKKYPTKILLGLSDAQLADLDEWRRDQKDLPSRSEAIRRLMEAALKSRKAVAAKKST
jgi:metal-responsive CopG/Arc/MetJ family transcriptional regulator